MWMAAPRGGIFSFGASLRCKVVVRQIKIRQIMHLADFSQAVLTDLIDRYGASAPSRAQGGSDNRPAVVAVEG